MPDKSPKLPVPIKHSRGDTVILFNLDKVTRHLVSQECRKQKTTPFETSIPTDLIAVPSFLMVVDFSKIKKTVIHRVYEWMLEALCKDDCILFVKEPPVQPPAGLQSRIIPNPKILTGDYIKFLILKRRAAVLRKSKANRSYDKKLFRLLFIIRQLRSRKIVYTKDLREEFNVTSRTVERDIDLICELGEPIEYDASAKGYRLLGEVL